MAVPSSSFVVDNPGDGVGTTSVPTNNEMCQRTGFRVKRDALVREWNGLYVRPSSYEDRHQQDFVRSIVDKPNRGSIRPDDTGRELTYVAISPSDL